MSPATASQQLEQAESRDVWPSPPEDRKKTAPVTAELKATKETEAPETDNENEPTLQDLKVPQNDKELSDLISRERKKLEVLGKVHSGLRQYALLRTARRDFRLENPAPLEALRKDAWWALSLGAVTAFIAGVGTLSLPNALFAGAVAFGVVLAAGVTHAVKIFFEDRSSSSKKDARYYFRGILRGATSPALSDDQQERLIETAGERIEKQQKKLANNIEALEEKLRILREAAPPAKPEEPEPAVPEGRKPSRNVRRRNDQQYNETFGRIVTMIDGDPDNLTQEYGETCSPDIPSAKSYSSLSGAPLNDPHHLAVVKKFYDANRHLPRPTGIIQYDSWSDVADNPGLGPLTLVFVDGGITTKDIDVGEAILVNDEGIVRHRISCGLFHTDSNAGKAGAQIEERLKYEEESPDNFSS